MEIMLSREAYRDYVQHKDIFHNERIRPDGLSFWDAMLSEEADFTKTPAGKQILETIAAL